MLTAMPLLQGWRERLRGSSYWRDIAWLLSGNVVAHGFTLATMPILSRLFTPVDFALLSLFLAGVTSVALVASLRYEYVVQLPPEDGDAWRICQAILGLGVLVVVTLTPLAWLLRARIAGWAGTPAFAPWVPLVPLAASLTSLGFAAQAWTQRQGRYRRSGVAEAVEKGVRNLIPCPVHALWPGAVGLILGNITGMAAKVLFVFRMDLFRFRLDLAGARRVLRAYAPICGSLLLSHCFMTGSLALIVVSFSRLFGADRLGQYAMANTVIALPSVLLGTAVGNAYYQRAAEAWAHGRSFHDLWTSTARRLFMVGLPVYAGAMALLPWLVPVMLGAKWQEAGRFASILSVSAYLSFATTPMDRTCLVVGAWWYVPLGQGARFLMIGLLAMVARPLGFGPQRYLWLLVASQCLYYLGDCVIQWGFARRRPT